MVYQTFRGECLEVHVHERAEGDPHLAVSIGGEDDGEWFEDMTFSSAWIDELITQLQLAQAFLKTQEPDIAGPDHPEAGKQFGWKARP
jgi:hypothetical protein